MGSYLHISYPGHNLFFREQVYFQIPDAGLGHAQLGLETAQGLASLFVYIESVGHMRLREVLAVLFLLCGFQSIKTYGQVVSTWDGGTGNWSVSTNWDPVAVPNNGGGTTYSVTISAPSSGVTMDVPNDTIDDLTLGATTSLNIYAGYSLSLVSGASTNAGTLNDILGSLTNFGTLVSTGTLYNGHATLGNSGTLINSGALVNAESDLGNSGTLMNSGTLSNADSSVSNYGTLINTGSSNYTNSDLSSSATLVNAGTLNIGDVSYVGNTGRLINSGIINIGTGITGEIGNVGNTGTLINSGAINIGPHLYDELFNSGMLISAGTLTSAGLINNTGTFTNSGAVTISSSGLFTTSTNYAQTGGSTLVNGTLTATGSAIVNIQGGTLGGTGTINGYVAMAGTITPGEPGTPGTLTIFGNYEQTGTLEELMSPLSQSFLNVSGNVTLDPGAFLDITLLNGFDPLGQTFDIMDYNALTGQFSNGSSFWDDGYLWDITHGQSEIDVTAVSTPEPSSLLLLFIGLAALAFYAHRKNV